jgi:hypothetical protein
MRTMSWSRYHTFTRIPTRLRRRAAKRTRHAAKPAFQKAALQRAAAEAVAARPEPERQSGDLPRGSTSRFLVRIRQSLTRIFRTWRLRNRTDI